MVGRCPMQAPLGFALKQCVASKHTPFLPLTGDPSTCVWPPLAPLSSAPVPVPQYKHAPGDPQCVSWLPCSVDRLSASSDQACPQGTHTPRCRTVARDLSYTHS